MITAYLNHYNEDAFASSIHEFEADSTVKSILVFIADVEQIPIEGFSTLLKSLHKPIVGGVFPELIVESERRVSGVLVIGLPYRLEAMLVDLEDDFEVHKDRIMEFLDTHFINPVSVFIFVDALGFNKREFISDVYNYFGTSISYVGGGAGSLSFKQQPCIISNKGIFQNKALLAFSKQHNPLGVAHGWHSISEPLKVTEAEGNVLISLNWQPAFEVYKQVVEQHSGERFSAKNFFSISKSYPLGIAKLDAEFTVRDPYDTKDNKLFLVDDIPEGDYVHVLHGNKEYLLEGAKKAKHIAVTRSSNPSKPFFCIDCISRVLYMESIVS
jgi:hypothetical protein